MKISLLIHLAAAAIATTTALADANSIGLKVGHRHLVVDPSHNYFRDLKAPSKNDTEKETEAAKSEDDEGDEKKEKEEEEDVESTEPMKTPKESEKKAAPPVVEKKTEAPPKKAIKEAPPKKTNAPKSEEETEASPKKSTPSSKEAETPPPAKESTDSTPESSKKKSKTSTDKKDLETETKTVNDERTRGVKREGVFDSKSEGHADIDKVDHANPDNWIDSLSDPPQAVIKASLYSFLPYNDSKVCDTFNMTFVTVEKRKDEGAEDYSYHIVVSIDCMKNGKLETPGNFLLKFEPEDTRLLLTMCGHREEGEIVNWLMIDNEVPECMTPAGRREYLSQPLRHIHESKLQPNPAPQKTNFFSANFDAKEAAIAGSATVAFISVVAIVLIFVARKRKAQKDLERTIAGAKAEKAVEDDPAVDTDTENAGTVERKGLMDTTKAKSDVEVEGEGAFVNSPAAKV